MFQALLRALGWQRRSKGQVDSRTRAQGRDIARAIRAKYDAAQTTEDNRRHWANADGLSAAQANSPGVRRTLRNRSRYEVSNNSYARGIVNTLANDTIGTGPRLQLQLPKPFEDDEDLTPKEKYRRQQRQRRQAKYLQPVEKEFHRWAREIDLAGKLRTMRVARAQDGEVFAVLTTNNKLRSRVKLDLRLVEADQVTDAANTSQSANNADGIEIDLEGNPTRYRIVTDPNLVSAIPKWIDASQVIHWFRCDRPGQVRGVPEIMPALPLFAQLRRFTLATIAAAETAADFAAVIYSDIAGEPDDQAMPFELIELEQRMATMLPAGYKLGQIQSAHPATTYEMFKREILNEIARCVCMPYNVAACNSSKYNYASGRLDHQVYFRAIEIDQDDCERIILDRILMAWLEEAALIPDVIPRGLPPMIDWDHQWFWPGREHVDPAKEANAQNTRLKSGTTHRAREYAGQGCDVDVEDERAAASFGLTVEEYRRRLVDTLFPVPSAIGPSSVADTDPDDEEEDEDDDEQNAAAA